MDDQPPPAKRPRLSMACNECRRRKVKCDTETPKCRNCRVRNDVCTTTDPKQPSIPILREWIDQTETSHTNTLSQSSGGQGNVSSQSPGALPWARSPQKAASLISLNDDKGISPAQQPHEMAFNVDDNTDRFKMQGASSSQCLMKSLDVYLEAAHIPPLLGNFSHGMRQVEEMELPLLASLPTFPDASRRDTYVSAFFERIHPLYPLFDIDKVKATIQRLSSIGDLHSLPQDQLPLLVTAYLVVSLGADEQAERLTKDGTKYLIAAASLVGHIILVPYLPTVQALLLLTLVYRGRNKDGVGWQALGMAIRIAYSLGLHKHSVKNPSRQHGVQVRSKQLFHARIWAICCSLEKIMQLESGRPTMIQDVDQDHMMAPDQHPVGHNFLQWHMGLAQLQGLISHHIYGHPPGARTAREILSDTAQLDRSLMSWSKEVPEEFRPGNDLFCSNHEFHIAACISILYYQTVIALHRAALIAPASTFLKEVSNYSFDDSSRLRLQAGEAICVNSARSIARLSIELSDRRAQSRILNGGPLLTACIVLGISLVKNSGGRMLGADLELLKACTEHTAEHFLESGHNALFARGITSIYEQVRLHTQRKLNEKLSSRRPTEHTHSTDQDSIDQTRHSHNTESNQLVNAANREYPATNSINPNNESNAPASGILSQNLDGSDPPLQSQMSLPPMFTTGQSSHDTYLEPLPFDSLDVQELWTWMGDLDGFNTNIYQESYGSHGTR